MSYVTANLGVIRDNLVSCTRNSYNSQNGRYTRQPINETNFLLYNGQIGRYILFILASSIDLVLSLWLAVIYM
jgi:hypothetical protein